MNNAILIELAQRWENEALYETEQSVTESLRMCADALRMLVDLDQRAEALKPLLPRVYGPTDCT